MPHNGEATRCWFCYALKQKDLLTTRDFCPDVPLVRVVSSFFVYASRCSLATLSGQTRAMFAKQAFQRWFTSRSVRAKAVIIRVRPFTARTHCSRGLRLRPPAPAREKRARLKAITLPTPHIHTHNADRAQCHPVIVEDTWILLWNMRSTANIYDKHRNDMEETKTWYKTDTLIMASSGNGRTQRQHKNTSPIVGEACCGTDESGEWGKIHNLNAFVQAQDHVSPFGERISLPYHLDLCSAILWTTTISFARAFVRAHTSNEKSRTSLRRG